MLTKNIYNLTNIKKWLKPATYTTKSIVFYNKQISENGRNGNVKDSETIFQRMPVKDVVSYTAMLTAYANNNLIMNARKVFDEMPERSLTTWNAMITGYVRSENGLNHGFQLFKVMPERNAVSYATMIMGFVRVGDMVKAEEIFEEMPVVWRDPVCSNALISGYLKIGKLEEAIRVFERMVEKDVVSWSSMVDGYCKHEKIEQAKLLFDEIPEKNVVTWTAMINGYLKSACGSNHRPREGHQVHCLTFRMGFDFDVFLGNSVVSMYCRFGLVHLASKVFYAMTKRDVVSWNSLLSGYVQAQHVEEAYKLFEKMPRKDKISWTTMITGFFGEGLIKNSIELFNSMPNKDDIAWTAVITGFVSNEAYEEAFCWFIKMLRTSVRPNPFTLSSVLSTSSGLATLDQGLQIHAHVIKMVLESDLSIQNSLVSMYSKSGHVDDAYWVFRFIKMPNIVSLNSMITAYSQNGLGLEAIRLFEKMQNEGHVPNEITFLGLLSACTHMGLVVKGWNYFRAMKSSYGIEPGVDHYACMVDLFARSGLLDEAMKLINSMPLEPHSGVWGALLSASRTYLHLDFAKLAAQKLFELEPNNATPYVVLYDMYTLTGKRKEGEGIRVSKKSKGIKKSPGCSWITLKDMVCVFSAGDQTNSSFGEIQKTLGTIMYEVELLNSLRTSTAISTLI